MAETRRIMAHSGNVGIAVDELKKLPPNHGVLFSVIQRDLVLLVSKAPNQGEITGP